MQSYTFDLRADNAAEQLANAFKLYQEQLRASPDMIATADQAPQAVFLGTMGLTESVAQLRNYALAGLLQGLMQAGGTARVLDEKLDGEHRFALFSDTTEEGVTISELIGVLTFYTPASDGFVDMGLRIQFGTRLNGLARTGLAEIQAEQATPTEQEVASGN